MNSLFFFFGGFFVGSLVTLFAFAFGRIAKQKEEEIEITTKPYSPELKYEQPEHSFVPWPKNEMGYKTSKHCFLCGEKH